MNSIIVPKSKEINLEELADIYCKENNSPLVDGVGFNNGLEIRYCLEEGTTRLQLTRFHDVENKPDDYEYAVASRQPGKFLTQINYVALATKRFYEKFKEVPKKVDGYSYKCFLIEMKKEADKIMKQSFLDCGMSLKHTTDAYQDELKRILDVLIR